MNKHKSVLEKRWKIVSVGWMHLVKCGGNYIGGFEFDKETASHIVRLHNANLKKGKTK